MKCWACSFDEDQQEESYSRQKFIRSELKVCFEKDGNWHNITACETVFICPDCGTLKVGIN